MLLVPKEGRDKRNLEEGVTLKVGGAAVREGRSPHGPFLSQQDPLAPQ